MQMRRSWIWSGLGAAVLVLSLLPVPDGMQGRTICTFRNLFDLPCPGCGVTRSLRAAVHGDWSAAIDHNPFGPVFLLLAVVLLLAPLWQRLWPDWDLALVSQRWARIAALALVVAMLAYGFWRILHVLNGRS
jgi:hypothetical protein